MMYTEINTKKEIFVNVIYLFVFFSVLAHIEVKKALCIKFL